MVHSSNLGQPLRGNVPDSWTIIDYNNDGRQDIMYQEGNNWKVRLGNSGATPSFGSEINVGVAGSSPKFSAVFNIHGDGLPDIVYWDSNLTLKYQKLAVDPTPATNQPYHFEAAQTIPGIPACDNSVASCFSYFPIADRVKPTVADFDGDGRVDFLVHEIYVDTFGIGCENPSGWGQPPPGIPVWTIYLSGGGIYAHISRVVAENEIRTVDINGDGLSDLAYRDTSNVWFYRINNGDGFEAEVSLGAYAGISATRAMFLDYDRDGDGDFLYPSGNFWQMRKYSSTGFSSTVNSTSLPAKSSSSSSPSHWHTAFVDLNGDGKLEAVTGDDRDHSGSNIAMFTYANGTRVPEGVMTKITNGFGAETDITYKVTTDPAYPDLYEPGTGASSANWGEGSPVFDLNAPMWVVQQVASTAPSAGSMPGSVDQNSKSSISYEYSGFKMQAGGRGALGFQSVTSIDDQTLIETESTYRQDFPYTGRPLNSEVMTGSGARLSYATNTWSNSTTSAPHRPFLNVAVEQNHATDTTNSATGAFSVGSVLTTTTTTTTMHSGYHIYGDIGTIEVATVAGGHTFTKTTVNTYHTPNVADWHTGRLATSTVTHNRTDNSFPSVDRTSSFTYDSATGQLETETVELGGAQAHTLTITYSHDNHGNITETRHNGYRGFQLYGDTQATTVDRIGKVDYDTDHRYTDYVENHYGHRQTTISRNRYGSVTEAQDAVGNRARTAYGALGRQYWSGDDVGGSSQSIHRTCGSVGCPTGAAFRIQNLAAGGAESFAYFDVLGREIRSATKMFDGLSWAVVVEEYDTLGRVVHSSEPFSSGTPDGGTPTYWTRIVYDDLGRPTQTVGPDTSVSSIDYDGLDTVSTDALGKTRLERKNGAGELVRAQDDMGGFVDYEYDEQGNLTKSTQGGPSVTSVISTMGYDLLGRKTSMSDADMGNWSYEYNAFGELIRQTTGTGDRTEIGYDRLGRMVQRVDYENGVTDPASDSGWVYDTAPLDGGGVALGQLALEDTVEDPENAATTPIRRVFTYDQFGRAKTATTEILEGSTTESYVARKTYDHLGRVFQEFDGAESFSGVEYAYNFHGYLARILEAANSATSSVVYSEVLAMDARGNVTLADKGALTVSHTFDPATGRPTEMFAEDLLAQTVQNLDLVWDEVGNLKEKHDQNRRSTSGYKNILEEYTYDDLHRLSTVEQNNVQTLSMGYDAQGNIKQKHAFTTSGGTDANANVSGTYGYISGTHKLNNAGGANYTYDGNGSMLSGDGRSITWGVHNKPTSITRGSNTVDLDYGPSRNRYRRVDNSGQSSEKTTHYAGSIEKTWLSSGVVETKRYIAGEVIVTVTDNSGSISEEVNYLVKDHLGSTELIVSDTGTVIQAMSFDPFGARRNDLNFASLTTASIVNFDVSVTTRGFTGHEGLDGVGLIHMNGRVYDPRLGRFISADPIVQAPTNTQNLNRYAYVLNNPLSYTDPSGHFFKKFAGLIAGAALTIATGGAASPFLASWYGAAGLGAITGAVGAAVNGGNIIQGAVIGAFSAAAFYGVGSHFDGMAQGNQAARAATLESLGIDDALIQQHISQIGLTAGQAAMKIAAHALVGGTMSVLQGGKFGHGFASAGVAQAFAGRIGNIDKGSRFSLKRVAAAAVLGGTASKISGGKFANGAVTGAFSRAFNDELHNDSVSQTLNRIGEGISFRYNAVVDGVSRDFSNGFVDGVIEITGGRSESAFLEDVNSNFGKTSIVFGSLSLDKTITSVAVSGQMASRWGGMTIGQWAMRGFAPANHLSSRAATARLVAFTSVVQSAAPTVSYEGGNYAGSVIRVTTNRLFRYFGDD